MSKKKREEKERAKIKEKKRKNLQKIKRNILLPNYKRENLKTNLKQKRTIQ